ncbi:Hsp70 family protein [Amycolatopsis sp. NPDC004079]|uniref:Hsp70 family protein n=1 Tax=Amycolatopsis sp. NPDC004079 TaxID=3154549 RepID=UPI0033A3B1FE
MTVVHLGLDLGSTALRAASAARGEAVTATVLAGGGWPWLSGVRPFPSVKSKLGVEPEAAETVAAALRAVRGKIGRVPGTRLGHTVISVPARFSSAARTALLAAAEEAGFADVSLISDTVAAVTEQAEGTRTGTYLVYSAGYDGCELGLARAVRGSCRVLGYEAAPEPDGRGLDADIIGSWQAALDRYRVPKRPGESGRARELAEQVKHRLAAGESGYFPCFVPVPGRGELRTRFDQALFNQQVRAAAAATLDSLTALLARTGADLSAVDQITLVGGTAAMPAVRAVLDGLGLPVAAAEAGQLARGALRHAQELGRRPLSAYDEPGPAAGLRRTRPLASLATTVLVPATQKSTMDSVRAAGPATAPELIATARRLFAAGRHAEAISAAHLAWRADPHDADVFEEMLDLHCAAAMTSPTLASFAGDEHWLRCALRHDQASTRIRGLLAERNYWQARDLLLAGNRGEAQVALDAALRWGPDHPGATALSREFGPR